MTTNHYDSREDTERHIERVQTLLFGMIANLHTRRREHDLTKLVPPEKQVFDRETPNLKSLEYGSDEYKQALERMKVALDHHYANNRHHPEFAEVHEEWMAIEGYGGIYDVSNKGRVRSSERVVPRKGDRDSLTVRERLMRPHLTPKGYQRVQLSRHGKPRNHLVHVLVAEAFLINDIGTSAQVNHKDGQKQNNCIENLEYVTPSGNLQHAYDNNLRKGSAKYIVTCEDLGVSTVGMNKMEEELRKRGYEDASAAGIWLASVGDSKTHLGLRFRAEPIAEASQWNGMAGMSLLDLVEMLADWKAATERHDTGDIDRSIDINSERFGYDEMLRSIFHNTVREMGWEATDER